MSSNKYLFSYKIQLSKVLYFDPFFFTIFLFFFFFSSSSISFTLYYFFCYFFYSLMTLRKFNQTIIVLFFILAQHWNTKIVMGKAFKFWMITDNDFSIFFISFYNWIWFDFPSISTVKWKVTTKITEKLLKTSWKSLL